jgi:choloylglycine hydrolase
MCTNFLLTVPAIPTVNSSTVQYISARCMELTGTLATNLYLVPAQQQFPLVKNQSQPWTGTYGFVALADPAVLSVFPCFFDGINQVGLSVASLWLPGTQYPTSGSSNLLEFYDFGAWVLSNFASVANLVTGLSGINVIGPPSTQKGYLPLHFIATDNTGASVVIEFVGGAMNVYPPTYNNGATGDGVLTNAPTYDWQRTNLANYSNLTVEGAGTSTSGNSGPLVGAGLLGVPGDPMSASRFVKAVTFRQGFSLLPGSGSGWLPTAADAGATNTSQTIVNVALQMVQMIQATPYATALIAPKPPSQTPTVGDWTMWQVARDHTSVIYYFSTAFNSALQAVNLNSVNFGGGSVGVSKLQSIPVMPGPTAWYTDVSTTFS